MKNFLVMLLVGLSLLFVSTTTPAEPGWEISVQESYQNGSFDYTFYYPYSSQAISKVSLSQNQPMTTLNAKYNLSNEKGFIELKFGKTGLGVKGRGSDSDWMIEGSDTLTDYGDFDVYGKQRLITVDLGKVLINNGLHRTNLMLGWVQRDTANELKNVVYHLIDGEDIGNQSQPDNGSYLDGKFKGLLFGISDDLTMRSNLMLTAKLNLLFLNTKAYGHWANHEPAWDWEDSGNTVGYEADIGLRYAVSSNLRAEVGYFYNYAKSTGCRETLNGELLTQLADLQYELKGLYLGLVMMF